jgi:hypothetical protein
MFPKVWTNGGGYPDHGEMCINVNATDQANSCPDRECQSSDRHAQDPLKSDLIVEDESNVAAQETAGVESPTFASEMKKVLDFERESEISALLFRIERESTRAHL